MHRVYFATNRSYAGGSRPQPPTWFDNSFNPSGPYCFRVGSARVDRQGDAYTLAEVNVQPERKGTVAAHEALLGQDTQWPEPLPGGYRRRRSVERKGSKVGSQVLMEDLYRLLVTEQRHVIAYIHGYANSFENSLLRAAQLQHEYRAGGKEPVVFAFSWPSDASTTPFVAYRNDRQDAKMSGVAIARALMRFVEFLRSLDSPADREAPRPACECPIHLVAHSMGNWALRHALLEMGELLNSNRLPRLFENVFLMAADEDDDALEHEDKLRLLLRLGHQTHVYHAANDRALLISDVTKGNPDRLGADGPRNLSNTDDRVSAIDCGEVSYTTLTQGRHQYYRLRSEVIEDVCNVLDGLGHAPEYRVGEARWKLRQA